MVAGSSIAGLGMLAIVVAVAAMRTWFLGLSVGPGPVMKWLTGVK